VFLVLMLSNGRYYVFHIIYAVVLIIVTIIFMNVVHAVEKFKNDVGGLVSSAAFCSLYFRPNESIQRFAEGTSIENTVNNIKKMSDSIMSGIITLDQNVDWFVINYITNQEWDKYVVFGVEITDGKIAGNLLGIILAVITGEGLLSIINQF
jgi:hypothetical protein